MIKPIQPIDEVKRNFAAVMQRNPDIALTDRNFEIIGSVIDQAQGNWSENNIQYAVDQHRKTLDKHDPNAATAAAAPTQPAEVLGTCSDGRLQLPIDATEDELRAASLAQVKDVLKRRRDAAGVFFQTFPAHAQMQKGDLR